MKFTQKVLVAPRIPVRTDPDLAGDRPSPLGASRDSLPLLCPLPAGVLQAVSTETRQCPRGSRTAHLTSPSPRRALAGILLGALLRRRSGSILAGSAYGWFSPPAGQSSSPTCSP